jgi:hypothetical protein
MIAIAKSENSKLGEGMGATYRSKDSCPKDCFFYNKLCYGKQGYTNIAFEKATKQGTKKDANEIYNFIKSLPIGKKLRHFVVGDLCADNKLDWNFIKAMIRGHTERPDVQAFGFTHAWRRFKANPFTQENLTINASAEKPEQIALAKKRGFDTVLVVPEGTPIGKSNYKGVDILVCPSQASEQLIEQGKMKEKIVCSKCMLCAKKNRSRTIAFIAHSSQKKSVSVMLNKINGKKHFKE